ncbi:MAG: TonB family protein [Calditrichaeota bacterium]|nr:MAG: TonB family protein [Calditrichota bacterium]
MRRKIIYIIIISLLAPLVSAKDKGNIQILCEAKVKVFLNNVYKGKSREKLNGYFLKNLEYGTYNIELEYRDNREEFSVDLQDTLYTYISTVFTRKEDEQMFVNPDSVESSEEEDFIPVDIFPELIHREEIQMPEIYSSDTIKGVASMKAFVDENGIPTEILIHNSSGSALIDSLAIEAGKKNIYLPGMYKKKPVGCWVNYKIAYPKGYSPIPNQNANYPDENVKVDVDVYPEMIYNEPPEYPKSERNKGVTGTVWVKLLVGKDGNVKRAMVGKSSGNRALDKAAIQAAYKNKFKPGIQNGKPVAVWITYKVNFDLDN